MRNMRKDFDTGKAVHVEGNSASDKANAQKAMRHTEIQSIALVALRRQIEAKKAERL